MLIDAPTVVGRPDSLFWCILSKVLSAIGWTVVSSNILDFKCQHLYRRFNLSSKVCFLIITILLKKISIILSICYVVFHMDTSDTKNARPTPDKLFYISSVYHRHNFLLGLVKR